MQPTNYKWHDPYYETAVASGTYSSLQNISWRNPDWTEEEERRLTELIPLHRKGRDIDWKAISALIPEKTSTECKKQFTESKEGSPLYTLKTQPTTRPPLKKRKVSSKKQQKSIPLEDMGISPYTFCVLPTPQPRLQDLFSERTIPSPFLSPPFNINHNTPSPSFFSNNLQPSPFLPLNSFLLQSETPPTPPLDPAIQAIIETHNKISPLDEKSAKIYRDTVALTMIDFLQQPDLKKQHTETSSSIRHSSSQAITESSKTTSRNSVHKAQLSPTQEEVPLQLVIEPCPSSFAERARNIF